MVLDHPEVADKLLKSNAKVTFDNDYDKHTIRPGGNTAHKLLELLPLLVPLPGLRVPLVQGHRQQVVAVRVGTDRS